MKIYIIPLIIILIINALVDYVIYKELKKLKNKSGVTSCIHMITSIILGALTILIVGVPNIFYTLETTTVMTFIYCLLSIYLPKYLYVIISAIGLLPFCKKAKRHINLTAIIIALFVFAEMIYASTATRFSPEINEVEIEFSNLPESFDGYRIAQISDFHLGTLKSDTTYVHKVVSMINNEKPDAIVFTGDLVNSTATEAIPHVATLSHLNAPDGVFSILGNHDYGDYSKWNSDEEKAADVQLIKTLQAKANWKLLLDETKFIARGNDSIAIIGVENVGDRSFHTYGNLKEAYRNLQDNYFKILLSHNPAHWRMEVVENTNIDIMLAGHTHAMQTMFTIFGHKISPSSKIYKEWSGLYQEGKQYLYVNIGIGSVGMPARFGANPEITILKLKHKKD